jgi:hypothetical protein
LFFKILLVYEYLRYAQWDNDDYDVLADGVVVGRIMETAAAPVGQPWIWMLAFGHHEDRTPTHGYAETREAAMEAFAKSIAPSRRGWQISARRCEDRIERRRATGAADARLWAPRRPHAHARLCRDARGCDGGVRQEYRAVAPRVADFRAPV